MAAKDPYQTVYSYYLPEVRPLVERTMGVGFHWMASGKDGIHKLLLQNIEPGLDDIHLPVMDRYEKAFASDVAHWTDLDFRYWTNGSSEGLFHLLARHKGNEKSRPLYQLDGEYQGYQAYAEALGMHFETVDNPNKVPPGLFFVSHPSAIDGNLLDSGLLNDILARHQVVLDVAYMGTTIRKLGIDASHPNLVAMVGSMSKPFGLYYFRIGMLWAKFEMPSLYGNRWFKNALSIKVADEVLKGVDIEKLKCDYREKQLYAIGQMDVEALPSDVWLLAHHDQVGDIRYMRGKGFRYCLTPAIMEMEKAHA